MSVSWSTTLNGPQGKLISAALSCAHTLTQTYTHTHTRMYLRVVLPCQSFTLRVFECFIRSEGQNPGFKTNLWNSSQFQYLWSFQKSLAHQLCFICSYIFLSGSHFQNLTFTLFATRKARLFSLTSFFHHPPSPFFFLLLSPLCIIQIRIPMWAPCSWPSLESSWLL